MYHVLILAWYETVRAGLKSLINANNELDVVGEARSIEELANLTEMHHPDVVIIDPVGQSFGSVISALNMSRSATLVLSTDLAVYAEMLGRAAQAWAIIDPASGGFKIATAIKAVCDGMIVVDHGVFGSHMPLRGDTGSVAIGERSSETPAIVPLTAREHQVLQLIAQGLPNKNIASRLNVSLSTIKFHVASILDKLGAASRTEAVTVGLQRGLVSI